MPPNTSTLPRRPRSPSPPNLAPMRQIPRFNMTRHSADAAFPKDLPRGVGEKSRIDIILSALEVLQESERYSGFARFDMGFFKAAINVFRQQATPASQDNGFASFDMGFVKAAFNVFRQQAPPTSQVHRDEDVAFLADGMLKRELLNLVQRCREEERRLNQVVFDGREQAEARMMERPRREGACRGWAGSGG
ncbi:hypothetical protein BJ508DRAFT_327449 [Ascobolus immersus RN42]|uniref:Uncharacterized protein n=1 Tax=Ascobolus immersus RN42 TaxID=1160509 RepID=A0A3N4I2M0_ASCIM|nr:hypothetical protein BJ508DRAFT_327449 [Ascobolus immersus RN42]